MPAVVCASDGKTETAVGEVGATLRLESDYDGGYTSPWEGS